MSENTIALSPSGQYLRREALDVVGGILPGHLLAETPVGVTVNGNADQVAVRALFADINIGDAGDIDRAYGIGETVHYVSASKGAYVRARVGASQTIVVGAQVAADSDGTVKIPALAGVGILGVAREAVITGAAQSAFIVIEII